MPSLPSVFLYGETPAGVHTAGMGWRKHICRSHPAREHGEEKALESSSSRWAGGRVRVAVQTIQNCLLTNAGLGREAAENLRFKGKYDHFFGGSYGSAENLTLPALEA